MHNNVRITHVKTERTKRCNRDVSFWKIQIIHSFTIKAGKNYVSRSDIAEISRYPFNIGIAHMDTSYYSRQILILVVPKEGKRNDAEVT